MIGKAKCHVRDLIGRHRRSAPIRGLHHLAAFIEASYCNEGSDLGANGESALLARLAETNPRIVLDVGANRGDWVLEALRYLPKCRIDAFEVAPVTFAHLSETVKQHDIAHRVTLNPFGLAEFDGNVEMYYFPDHPELTCDMPRHAGHSSTPFSATVRSGDGYLRSLGIDKVDYLKIDVEGAEHRVLKGFSEALQARRIQSLQFEYGAFSIDTRILLRDYYTLLSPNYWVGKIYPSYVEFADYDWRQEDYRFANYCAVSKSRPDLRRLLEGYSDSAIFSQPAADSASA